MARGKNPTVAQRRFIASEKLNAREWLITKDTPELMELVNRESKEVKEICKGVVRN